ncbi:MAG: hypothetical protein ACYTHM_19330, partial [Planctomycetota bacterium]
MRHLRIPALLAFLFLAGAGIARAEEKGEEGLVLPRPEGIDDATWEKLRKGYAQEKEQFLRVLAALEKNRIDYLKDGIRTILEKKKVLREILIDNMQATLSAMADPAAVVLNIVQIRNETSPRLTGRIVRVGPGGEFENLGNAFRHIRPGDLIRLGKGSFRLPSAQWRDIAVVGRGPKNTELAVALEAALRLRIEGVKIDCKDTEAIDIRDNGAIHLKDCHIFNYNSGAGGSNAIFTSGSVLFVEGCVFEGMSGRAAGRGSGGDAFDMRGDNVLFCRKTKFIDNQEILRATFPCGFDECISENKTKWDSGITPYQPGYVFLRKNKATVRSSQTTVPFQRATDDIA